MKTETVGWNNISIVKDIRFCKVYAELYCPNCGEIAGEAVSEFTEIGSEDPVFFEPLKFCQNCGAEFLRGIVPPNKTLQKWQKLAFCCADKEIEWCFKEEQKKGSRKAEKKGKKRRKKNKWKLWNESSEFDAA